MTWNFLSAKINFCSSNRFWHFAMTLSSHGPHFKALAYFVYRCTKQTIGAFWNTNEFPFMPCVHFFTSVPPHRVNTFGKNLSKFFNCRSNFQLHRKFESKPYPNVVVVVRRSSAVAYEKRETTKKKKKQHQNRKMGKESHSFSKLFASFEYWIGFSS